MEGLHCIHYIQSLRREAHQALNEHVRLIHRDDTTRFAKLLIALSMLRTISPPVVAQLFLRPVIGAVNVEEVLMEMFYGSQFTARIQQIQTPNVPPCVEIFKD